MGWLIAFTFRHAYEYVVGARHRLLPRRAVPRHRPLRSVAPPRARAAGVGSRRRSTRGRRNAGAIGMFALVLCVILLVWARASLIVFALFYTGRDADRRGLPRGRCSRSTTSSSCSPTSASAASSRVLVFAISVVSVPMMLDRDTDGVVAVLTSLQAFGANVPAMLVWGTIIVALIAAGFALVLRRARRRGARDRARDVARVSRAGRVSEAGERREPRPRRVAERSSADGRRRYGRRRGARHALLPLDRAADRRMLDRRRRAGARDRHHRVEQLARRRRVGRASRRVEPAAVGELQVAVEAEEIRRADGAVGARDVLRLVDHVGEREAVLRGERLHVGRTNPRDRRRDRCS